MKRETNHEEAGAPFTEGERTWRAFFYLMSAAMAGYALLQIGAGRFAAALGDLGVACLMISLIPQFPFIRAILVRRDPAQAQDQVLRDLERVHAQSPWAESVSAAGWILLGMSFLLRALGMG
jgi:hypothetical protein